MTAPIDIDAPITECPVCGAPGESRANGDRYLWECSTAGCYMADSPAPLTVAPLVESSGGPALVGKLRAAQRDAEGARQALADEIGADDSVTLEQVAQQAVRLIREMRMQLRAARQVQEALTNEADDARGDVNHLENFLWKACLPRKRTMRSAQPGDSE